MRRCDRMLFLYNLIFNAPYIMRRHSVLSSMTSLKFMALIYKCAKRKLFSFSIQAVIVVQSSGRFLWATRYNQSLFNTFCQTELQENLCALHIVLRTPPSVISIPQNLKSKSGATPPLTFGLKFTPSIFELKFPNPLL